MKKRVLTRVGLVILAIVLGILFQLLGLIILKAIGLDDLKGLTTLAGFILMGVLIYKWVIK